MDKERAKKLAGINEGRAFRNGDFKLDRYKVFSEKPDGFKLDKSGFYGDWCATEDVAKLEELAGVMYNLIERVYDIEPSDGHRVLELRDEIKQAMKTAKTL